MKKLVLSALAVFVCSMCFISTDAFAKREKIKLIDFEHHYCISELLDYLATRAEVPRYNKETKILELRKGFIVPISTTIITGRPMYNDLTSFAKTRLEDMDRTGVDVAVLSAITIIESLPKEESIKYSKMCNDRVYKLVKKYPKRFIGSATLPTIYVEEAMAELKRCKKMGFKYWHTNSNYGKEHLYDDKYEPLLKLAEELGMAIYIHPEYPTDEKTTNMGSAFSGPGYGFGVDVMDTTLRLIVKGTFDKYPNLKMIIGHLGEYYPYVLERMDNRFGCLPEPEIKNKQKISYYFKNKNIFVTTSGNMSKEAFCCAKNVIGIDNIMFGSDYPFEVFDAMVNFVESLSLTQEEREKLYYKNGEQYILNNK